MHLLLLILSKMLHWVAKIKLLKAKIPIMDLVNEFEYVKDASLYDKAIENLYNLVFGPGRFAKAAHILRENNICLYDISRIVIETKTKEIIGGCRMWPIAFTGGGNGLFLGPIVVKDNYRKHGLGAKLVEEVLIANKTDRDLPIFLVGDIEFFGKFGFEKVPNNLFKLPLPAAQNRILWKKSDNIQEIDSNYCGEVFAPRPSK
jgi:predicted N-acetyltransferase YhbS